MALSGPSRHLKPGRTNHRSQARPSGHPSRTRGMSPLALGFAAQQHELYHDCFQKGLSRDEFVVFCVEPLTTEMFIGPLLLTEKTGYPCR
jgi:hypothetical protein